ncbi:ribosomal protein s11 domain-containing protein [Ditylenchus destructor]|uniref:Ribosomal protein s11 domain-containing protein n=1 Tax=Ditylenchus destructor TaxID=166010 RepID=A0AAD4RAF2_9BILA|nr:ribosomal protein s11 domain-containing protein [Ditylenchus destructor]
MCVSSKSVPRIPLNIHSTSSPQSILFSIRSKSDSTPPLVESIPRSGPLSYPHRRGAKTRGVSMEDYRTPLATGTIGEDAVVTLDTEEIDQFLPNLDTLTQEFYGIKFTRIPIAYIASTRNNTKLTVMDVNGKCIVQTSARIEGFKNARKKTNLAGQAAGQGCGLKLIRRRVNTVRVVIKGIGSGRMTSVKGLTSAGINVVSITDRTPLPDRGPRGKKQRRV